MTNVGSNTLSLGMGTQLGPHHFPSSLHLFIKGGGGMMEDAKISTGNRPRELPPVTGSLANYTIASLLP